MSYEVLARKWRPQRFEDVIGQEHITKTLINAIKSNRLAHAYLFSGPRGVGKTSVARILAKSINCTQGEPGAPCNKCPSCIEITRGSSMDVQEIDGASNRGIDEIRELREGIRYTPSSSPCRVYIIDEVHMLTLAAFNALLKTLEEPPEHVKFIFATTEAHKVPVTILSRCQRFDFKRITPARIIEHLEKITLKEDLEIPRSSLALIARESEGSMRDAESLLDQVVSFSGNRVSEKDVTEILGIIDRGVILDACRALIDGSAKRCLELIDRIYTYGYDTRTFYHNLMEQLRDLLVCLLTPEDYLVDFIGPDKDEIIDLAKGAGTSKLHMLLDLMIAREEALKFSSNPRLYLETTMIRLCRVGDHLSFQELIEKIEALEKRLAGTPVDIKPQEVRHDPAPDVDERTTGDEKSDIKADPPPAFPEKGWEDFLDFLSSKNRLMYSVLKDWELIGLEEGHLEINNGTKSFSSDYFDDKDTYDQFCSLCRQFFNERIKIIIRRNSRSVSDHDNKPKTQTEIRKRKDNSTLPDPVKEVLDVFQGKILDEK